MGIDKNIRKYLVEHKMLAGVVSMPSNIFATTGTNVSILFMDDSNKGNVVLIDASNLGEKSRTEKPKRCSPRRATHYRYLMPRRQWKTFPLRSAMTKSKQSYSLSAEYFDSKSNISILSSLPIRCNALPLTWIACLTNHVT